MVKVVFRPLVNQLVAGQPNMGTTSATGFPPLMTAIDYDDNSAPANTGVIMQYQSMKMTNSNRTHTRTLRPKMSQPVYLTSLVTGYRPTTGYIDCSYDTVPHYGLKVFADGPLVVPTTSSSMTYQVFMTYYLSFKNVR